MSGRYVVKIRTGTQSVPFTGVSDASGYFFVPFIPQGQPYTATAIDRATGQKRSIQGVGPATGKFDFLFFDFSSDGTQFGTASWDGGGDGTTWGDAKNWKGDTLPGPTDRVVIDVPGEATVRVNTAVHVISLSSKEALVLDNSLEIDAVSKLDNSLSMTPVSTLSGTGSLTVNGPLNVTGGVIDEAALNSAGLSSLNGGGALTLRNGARLNNLAAGTMAIKGDFSIDVSSATSVTAFTNTGTLVKSVGTGLSRISCAFNNSGIVNVSSGSLEVGSQENSSTSSGSFNVAAAATLRFVGNGSVGHALTGTVTGAGTVEFNGGTDILSAGVYALGGTTSATVLKNASVSFGAGVDLQSLGATLNVLLTSNLNLSSGEAQVLKTLNLNTSGIVTASDSITAGAMTLTDGTVRGSGSLNVPSGGTMTVARVYLDGFSLNNGGAGVVPQNGSMNASNGAVVNNLATGTLELQTSARLSLSGALATPLNNAGIVSSSGADVRVSFAVKNTGTVRVLSGDLFFTSGFTQTAGTTAVAGGTLSLQNGLAIDGGTLEGTGTISGDVTNGGVLRPGGAAAGSLSIQGAYTQTDSGKVDLGIGGTAASTFDRLSVSGVATLAGTLNVTLTGGFLPTSGSTFEVLQYASKVGDFSTKSLPNGLQANVGAASTVVVAP